MLLYSLITLLISYPLIRQQEERKLELIVQLVVNGNESLNKEDQSLKDNSTINTLIKNELTENGMKQMYIIGSSVWQQYEGFWEKEYNQSYYHIYSGNGPSQKTSAISLSQGLMHETKAEKMEHNEARFYQPPIKNFSGNFEVDPEYALPNGITLIPIEFPEENNDIMFNASNDCLALKKMVQNQQEKVQNEVDHIFTDLISNLKKANFIPQEELHPKA